MFLDELGARLVNPQHRVISKLVVRLFERRLVVIQVGSPVAGIVRLRGMNEAPYLFCSLVVGSNPRGISPESAHVRAAPVEPDEAGVAASSLDINSFLICPVVQVAAANCQNVSPCGVGDRRIS